MSTREKIARFVSGILIMFPVYGFGLMMFTDAGFEWKQSLFVSVGYSFCMLWVEVWLKRRQAQKEAIS
ncbi:MAG: hypothetical protein RLN83_13875 [Balneola sp.]